VNGARLRIGLVSTFYPTILGGAETSLHELLPALMQQPLSLTLLSPRLYEGGSAHQWRLLDRFPREAKIMGIPPVGYLFRSAISSHLRRGGTDLLHLYDAYCVVGATIASRLASVPYIISFHNNIGVDPTTFGVPRWLSRWFRHREHRLLEEADKSARVLALSHFIASSLTSVGVSSSKVETVYLGGSIHTWPQLVEPETHTPFKILMAGRLQEHKGFQYALGALCRLVEQGVSYKALVVGDGPFRRRLQHLVERLALPDVVFLGRRAMHELDDLYRRCHVCVVPTTSPEPFGRVAVEAMRWGKPVVASHVGGLPEIVLHGVTGYLVTPRESEGIAQALFALYANPTEAAEMGLAGRERAQLLFDARSIARKLHTAYDRAVGP
jgi:glycosyltransferase involved in cell wall biosynthesis